MTGWDNLYVALANLKANKVRSSLSMLGIIIGTGAVIVVTSVVNGIRQATLESMSAGTENLIRLRPTYSKKTGRYGKITLDDVERLKRIPLVKSVMPEISDTKQVKARHGLAKARLVGVNEDYLDLFKYKLIDGRNLSVDDVEMRRGVCLVDQSFVDKLFGIMYPLGQRIRLENYSLDVVGIVESSKELNRWGKKGDLLVPVTTLLRIMGTVDIYSVEIRAEDGKIDKVKKTLNKLIQNNARQKDLLSVEDPREYLKELEKWASMWMLQMILIAGISLLVGGIGLMNVMLTTVAERTREVGLRKALGANSKNIQHQFLVESAILSGLGGLSGVVLGYSISKGIQIFFVGMVQVAILPSSLVVSLLFSLALGIIFGLYPASKAAHLSPVEALRYE